MRRPRGHVAQSAVLFGARLSGALLTTLVQVAISRWYGPGVLGDYFLLIAGINILTMAMPLGFQSIGHYFAAEYHARGDTALIGIFARRAYGHIAVVAALAAAAASALAIFGAGRWPLSAAFAPPVMLMALAAAVIFVNGALLVGLKRPVAGLIADMLLRPIVMTIGFFVALQVATGERVLSGMLWVAAMLYLAVAAAQTAMLWMMLRRDSGAKPVREAEPARWWRFAVPSALLSLVVDFFFDIDMMLLAPLMTREELAVFGAAVRVFCLLAFAVGAIQTVLMPDIVGAGALGDGPTLHARIARANTLSLIVAGALAAMAVVSGPAFALLFGPAFAGAATPFTVLCLGLVVRCAAGPLTLILSIHERPAAGLPAAGFSIAVLAAGNIILVPRYGATGAALSALMATVLGTAALWVTARKQTQVDVSVLPALRQWFGRPA